MALISPTQPDWSRETDPGAWYRPSKRLLQSIRDFQRHVGKRRPVRRGLAVVRHTFWSVVTGADVPLTCNIGGGLLMPHPNGIVIHPKASIGVNCLIFQQVTIGMRDGRVPVIGGHVDIGAGAKIIGGVVIGNHAVIGANAVVLSDVPAGSTAVGIPARLLPKDGNHSDGT